MSGYLGPFLEEPRAHLFRLLKDTAYRHYKRLEFQLRNIPRFTACSVDFEGSKLTVPDAASLLSSYREIFLEKIYSFPFESSRPKILDLGANIGLSILFFKKLYPDAEITAFEADPKVFAALKENVAGAGHSDVNLINQAAWTENTKLQFMSEGADGGRIAQPSDTNLVQIDAIDLREHLKSHTYDFIKMDIEGAENTVIPACADLLSKSRFIFVEYHSIVGKPQNLPEILEALKSAGFRVHIHSSAAARSAMPFQTMQPHCGFDLQLNIFGWKQ